MWLECVTRVPLTWKTAMVLWWELKNGNIFKPPILGRALQFDISLQYSIKRVEILTDHKVAAYSLYIDLGEETVTLAVWIHRGRWTQYLDDPVSCLNTCPHSSPIWQAQRKRSIKVIEEVLKWKEQMEEWNRQRGNRLENTKYIWFHGAVVYFCTMNTRK